MSTACEPGGNSGLRGGGSVRKQLGRGGRPRKIPHNWKDILHAYVTCQIGKTELMRLMGIKCKQITCRTWYKEYLDEFGIASIRNNIDTMIVNGLHEPKIGETTGYIKYKNGTTKFLKKEA